MLAMKKLLLISIAALLLATGTAHADDTKWKANLHSCNIVKTLDLHGQTAAGTDLYGEHETVNVARDQLTVFLSLEDALAIQKELPALKKCSAFYDCVYKRDYLKHYASPGTTDPVKPDEKRPKRCYEGRR